MCGTRVCHKSDLWLDTCAHISVVPGEYQGHDDGLVLQVALLKVTVVLVWVFLQATVGVGVGGAVLLVGKGVGTD